MVGTRISQLGQVIMVGALVFFLGAFGLAKFTPHEIEAIKPLVAGSPLLSWLPRLVGDAWTSYLIGMVEIATALLIISRPLSSVLSAAGGIAAAATFLVTLSFLVSTPQLTEAMAGFIIKDVALLGVALWWAGKALSVHLREPRELI